MSFLLLKAIACAARLELERLTCHTSPHFVVPKSENAVPPPNVLNPHNFHAHKGFQTGHVQPMQKIQARTPKPLYLSSAHCANLKSCPVSYRGESDGAWDVELPHEHADVHNDGARCCRQPEIFVAAVMIRSTISRTLQQSTSIIHCARGQSKCCSQELRTCCRPKEALQSANKGGNSKGDTRPGNDDAPSEGALAAGHKTATGGGGEAGSRQQEADTGAGTAQVESRRIAVMRRRQGPRTAAKSGKSTGGWRPWWELR
ncbi:hypothetical protein GGX14DRAFT_404933 [Mycena pura]|uniref:Uncharacterized protein n=1 Tax=Mycena pura TaxID=153505 RepID=A0AAD6UT12_9AGAR|nr:hypothetical protein GGX14DRAFT_404933 [Mycena pura]